MIGLFGGDWLKSCCTATPAQIKVAKAIVKFPSRQGLYPASKHTGAGEQLAVRSTVQLVVNKVRHADGLGITPS